MVRASDRCAVSDGAIPIGDSDKLTDRKTDRPIELQNLQLFFSLSKIALATGFLKRFAHRLITYPSNQWRRNGIAPRNKKKQQTDFTGTKTKLENKTKKTTVTKSNYNYSAARRSVSACIKFFTSFRKLFDILLTTSSKGFH